MCIWIPGVHTPPSKSLAVFSQHLLLENDTWRSLGPWFVARIMHRAPPSTAGITPFRATRTRNVIATRDSLRSPRTTWTNSPKSPQGKPILQAFLSTHGRLTQVLATGAVGMIKGPINPGISAESTKRDMTGRTRHASDVTVAQTMCKCGSCVVFGYSVGCIPEPKGFGFVSLLGAPVSRIGYNPLKGAIRSRALQNDHVVILFAHIRQATLQAPVGVEL